MYTTVLLLKARSNEDCSTLFDALDRDIGRLDVQGGAITARVGLAHRRAEAIAGGERADLIDRLVNEGLVSNTVSVTQFDLAIEVSTVVPEAALAAVAGLVPRVAPFVDRSASAVTAGIDHRLMEGAGAIVLYFGLRSVEGCTRTEFHDWWRHELVAHTMHTPGKTGYRQIHTDRKLGMRAASAAGVPFDDLDGVAVETYPDLTAFFRAIDRGNQADAPATRAERQMIDMARARAIVTLAAPPAGH